MVGNGEGGQGSEITALHHLRTGSGLLEACTPIPTLCGLERGQVGPQRAGERALGIQYKKTKEEITDVREERAES